MKKIIVLFIAAIMLMMCASCGEQKQPESINGYEHAEFKKYNSPADENGLGGTLIYFDGTITKVQTMENTIFATVQDDGKKEWLVGLGQEPQWNENMYQLFLNKKVRVFGQYQGYSEQMKMPALFLKEMTDMETQLTYSLTDFLSFGKGQ